MCIHTYNYHYNQDTIWVVESKILKLYILFPILTGSPPWFTSAPALHQETHNLSSSKGEQSPKQSRCTEVIKNKRPRYRCDTYMNILMSIFKYLPVK